LFAFSLSQHKSATAYIHHTPLVTGLRTATWLPGVRGHLPWETIIFQRLKLTVAADDEDSDSSPAPVVRKGKFDDEEEEDVRGYKPHRSIHI